MPSSLIDGGSAPNATVATSRWMSDHAQSHGKSPLLLRDRRDACSHADSDEDQGHGVQVPVPPQHVLILRWGREYGEAIPPPPHLGGSASLVGEPHARMEHRR